MGDNPENIDDGLAEGGEVLGIGPASKRRVERGAVRPVCQDAAPNLRLHYGVGIMNWMFPKVLCNTDTGKVRPSTDLTSRDDVHVFQLHREG